MTTAGRWAVTAATTAVLATGCAAVDGWFTGFEDDPPGQTEPVILFEGVAGDHSWQLGAADSDEGPVLLSYRDGRLATTSWDFSRPLDPVEQVFDVSAGVPHGGGGDVTDPLLDLVLGHVRVDLSVDEVVIYREDEVVARSVPLPHPAAVWSVAPIAVTGVPASFWAVACSDGRSVGTELVWSAAQGSFTTPELDPCGRD